MEIGIIDVLISTVALLILAIPGYIMKKVNLVNESVEKGFSTFVLYVAQAFLVFMSFLTSSYTKEIGVNMLITVGITVLLYFAFIIIIKLFNLKDKDKNAVFHYGSVFGNVGFMGIPFLQMLFSGSNFLNEIFIYAGVCVVVMNIFNWTFGVYIISGDKREISIKKVLLNPVIISAILGCILFITIKKPISEIAVGTVFNQFLTKISSSFDLIKNTVTPLSMTVIGMKLADMKVNDMFLDKHSYFVCFFKLIVFPIITMAVISFLNISIVIKYTIYLTMSMPCATSTALFAVKYNREAKFATSTVLLTTLLSALSIPLTFIIFTKIFGIII